MALAELVADQTRRVFFLASYGIDTKLTPLSGNVPQIFIKPGSVSISGGPAISWPGGYIIPQNLFYGSRPPVGGGLALPFVANGTHQLYVDQATGNITMAVSSPGAAFPVGSLPLYVVTTDGVNRFQSVQDVRPASAGMTATKEVVSNSLYRASYGSSFSLSEVTALDSGAYAFQIGAGTMSVIVNLIGTSFYPKGMGGWFAPTQTYGMGG